MMNKELSPKQKEILNTTGKFVVNACAGSGKTFTLSKKLANLIETNNDPHIGIATLSFTNTAWKEIKHNLDKMGVEISYPHFIGTFDKFINKYIFYKYYYLLNLFKKRPILVGGVGTPWNEGKYETDYDLYFDTFSFNSENKIIKTTSKNLFFHFDENKYDKHHIQIKKMKFHYFKKGFVTQDDINYFSLKLIQKFDFIPNIIANKFPIFLIDEAQDTNKIKMKIIEDIIDNPNIIESIFIGDFNQAIYEWNGANPDSFKELTKKYNSINLDENWRSSRNICEFTSKLVKQKYKSVNPEIKSFPFVPEIRGYDDKPHNEHEFFNNLILEFLEICEENNVCINNNDIAVLCKGNSLINTIKGKSKLNENIFANNDILYDLIYSKLLFDSNNLHEAYLKLEYIVISLALKEKYLIQSKQRDFIENYGFFKMRQLCFDIIELMPPIEDITLNEWIKQFKVNLKKSNLFIKRKLLKNISYIQDDLLIKNLFENEEYSHKYSLSTIHKVKGESFDAVLLILKTKPSNYGYKSIVDEFKETGRLTEELRNIYVAITRPRKILVIYVPKSHEEMWYELFFNKPLIPKNQSTLSDF